MTERYDNQLSYGANNLVVALSGFVHRDIPERRTESPSNQSGERYDNVFLTNSGLRLIDEGISALRTEVGDKLFGKYLDVEEREIAEFRDYF